MTIARTGDIEHVVAPAPASYWLISVPARSIVERLYGDVCGMVDEACDHDTGFEIHPFELTFKPLFAPRDVVGDNLVGLIYYHEQSLWQVTGIDLRDRAAIVRVQRVCRRDVGDGWRMDVQRVRRSSSHATWSSLSWRLLRLRRRRLITPLTTWVVWTHGIGACSTHGVFVTSEPARYMSAVFTVEERRWPFWPAW